MSRRRNNRLFLILAVSLGSCGSAVAGGVNVPDWVRQAAGQPPGTFSAETKALVLLDQTDYTVTSPGEYTEHSRWVVKILRPEGRNEGDLLLDLGMGEKLNFIRSWTLDRAGHEFELKQKDFAEKSFRSFELYDDVHFLSAKAPAADPGSTIAFEWEVRRHGFVNQINQFFQEPNPVREMRISLTLPNGWEFRDSWPSASPVTPVQTSPSHWEWSAQNLPGIEEERMMPERAVLLGRLSITYFPTGEKGNVASWAALGKWYNTLIVGRRDPTPEITAKTQELIAGKADFDSKLRAITEFIQADIRYVAIEIGIGGYQPHAAADVFRYRYGDCKDKATLLSSMLRVAGIASNYVVIHTERGFVNPNVPSVWFNHMILAIELPKDLPAGQYKPVVKGKSGQLYLVFDPTDEYTPVGSLRSEIQDSYALLVTDGNGELIRTPQLDPAANTIVRQGHFVLGADGALSGEVDETRSGDFAMEERERLHDVDQHQRTNDFEHWLAGSLQAFTLQDLNFTNAEERSKDLALSYKIAVQDYGQSRGTLMLVRPRVVGDDSSFVEHKERHYPLELRHTCSRRDVFEIEVPKQYQVDDIPDPVKLDVGFAAYQSRVEVDGSKLRYSRQYILRDFSVPPDKYQDWVRLQGMIGADESAAVVLKRVQ
jgi:Domain of Unknown Function with PDB structure (DUF3857)/Transglutaminase-like superfamily